MFVRKIQFRLIHENGTIFSKNYFLENIMGIVSCVQRKRIPTSNYIKCV